MRVILDANIWLSLLAGSGKDGSRTIRELVNVVLTDDHFQLIVPIETIEEVERKATTKDYYQQIHAIERWYVLKLQLSEFVLLERMIESRIPGNPDPKDDYLLVAMELFGVDYLVTGDGKLINMGQYANGRIVSPLAFWKILNS